MPDKKKFISDGRVYFDVVSVPGGTSSTAPLSGAPSTGVLTAANESALIMLGIG